MDQADRARGQLGPVAAKVYEGLLRRLDSGELAPRARLPGEHELCAAYGASRTAVRSALARLAAERRIVSRRGSGTYVLRKPRRRGFADTVALMYQGGPLRLTALQDLALRRGYVVAIYSQLRSMWDPAREAEFLRQVLRQRHRSLVAFCSPLRPRNERLLRELESSGVRVLHIEYFSDGLPGQSYLLPDYRAGARQAAAALFDAGYERVVFASPERGGPFQTLARRGFLDALAERRGDGSGEGGSSRRGPDGCLALPVPARRADLPAAMDRFVRTLEPGTGLVCPSHHYAEWVLEALRRRKAAIGEEYGLVALHTVGEMHEGLGGIDHVTFGDRDIYERAVDLVTRREFGGVRQLVPPRLVRCGTVRGG